MTYSFFRAVVRARRGMFIAVWLGTIALVALASYLVPPHYVATATVVAEMKTTDPIAGIALPGGLISNYTATQVDILGSERVALRALRALKLQDDPAWRQNWESATKGQGDFDSWAAQEIERKLNVKPSRDSSAIQLSYTASDPHFSADVVNAVVQAYRDTAVDMRLEPARRYNAFFDERAKSLRDVLEQAQSKLSRFQQKHGLVATDEKLDVENTRLAELSSQVVALQSDAAETRGRQRQARINPRAMDEVLRDPLVASLQIDLSREEGRLAEMGSRLGDRHPQMISQRQLVSELRSRLTGALGRASGAVGVANSVVQGKLAEQTALLDAQRAKVLRLKGQHDEAQVMLRDIENAQRSYDAVLKRASETELESVDSQSSISVLKHATPPLVSWPKPPINIAIAAIVGLELALAVVLLGERFDRRLRTRGDVAKFLGLPLLVELPGSGGAHSKPQLQSRVVHGLAHSGASGVAS